MSKLFDVQALSMTPVQLRLYKLFVGLGPTRSLPALHKIAQEAGINVTPRMIRRWNAKLKWTALAKETQAQVAVQVIDEMKEELIDMTREELNPHSPDEFAKSMRRCGEFAIITK
jgi:hypothetical protein